MFSLRSSSFSFHGIVMKTHHDKTENQCEIGFLNPWPERISRNGKSHWSVHALYSPRSAVVTLLPPPVVQMQVWAV